MAAIVLLAIAVSLIALGLLIGGKAQTIMCALAVALAGAVVVIMLIGVR